MWEKLLNFARKHKITTGFIVFTVPLFCVHFLFKCHSNISWIEAEWSAGDMLAYIAGFEALLGTIILGEITVDLSKENNKLQQVMAQKLYPVLSCENAKADESRPTDEFTDYDIPQSDKFVVSYTYSGGQTFYSININVDNHKAPKYIKELKFDLKNDSEAVIGHIAFDHITVCGYKNGFDKVERENITLHGGRSLLLNQNHSISLSLKLYFDNEIYKEYWDNILGGAAVILYVTNTTITGITFNEYIELNAIPGSDEYRASYGRKGFTEEG